MAQLPPMPVLTPLDPRATQNVRVPEGTSPSQLRQMLMQPPVIQWAPEAPVVPRQSPQTGPQGSPGVSNNDTESFGATEPMAPYHHLEYPPTTSMQHQHMYSQQFSHIQGAHPNHRFAWELMARNAHLHGQNSQWSQQTNMFGHTEQNRMAHRESMWGGTPYEHQYLQRNGIPRKANQQTIHSQIPSLSHCMPPNYQHHMQNVQYQFQQLQQTRYRIDKKMNYVQQKIVEVSKKQNYYDKRMQNYPTAENWRTTKQMYQHRELRNVPLAIDSHLSQMSEKNQSVTKQQRTNTIMHIGHGVKSWAWTEPQTNISAETSQNENVHSLQNSNIAEQRAIENIANQNPNVSIFSDINDMQILPFHAVGDPTIVSQTPEVYSDPTINPTRPQTNTAVQRISDNDVQNLQSFNHIQDNSKTPETVANVTPPPTPKDTERAVEKVMIRKESPPPLIPMKCEVELENDTQIYSQDFCKDDGMTSAHESIATSGTKNATDLIPTTISLRDENPECRNEGLPGILYMAFSEAVTCPSPNSSQTFNVQSLTPPPTPPDQPDQLFSPKWKESGYQNSDPSGDTKMMDDNEDEIIILHDARTKQSNDAVTTQEFTKKIIPEYLPEVHADLLHHPKDFATIKQAMPQEKLSEAEIFSKQCHNQISKISTKSLEIMKNIPSHVSMCINNPPNVSPRKSSVQDVTTDKGKIATTVKSKNTTQKTMIPSQQRTPDSTTKSPTKSPKSPSKDQRNRSVKSLRYDCIDSVRFVSPLFKIMCFVCFQEVAGKCVVNHMLFADLQCRDCKLTISSCHQYGTLRRGTISKCKHKSGVHDFDSWAVDPVDFLGYKTRKCLQFRDNRSVNNQPTDDEILEEMTKYTKKLSMLQFFDPWKDAANSCKEYVQSARKARKEKHRKSSAGKQKEEIKIPTMATHKELSKRANADVNQKENTHCRQSVNARIKGHLSATTKNKENLSNTKCIADQNSGKVNTILEGTKSKPDSLKEEKPDSLKEGGEKLKVKKEIAGETDIKTDATIKNSIPQVEEVNFTAEVKEEPLITEIAKEPNNGKEIQEPDSKRRKLMLDESSTETEIVRDSNTEFKIVQQLSTEKEKFKESDMECVETEIIEEATYETEIVETSDIGTMTEEPSVETENIVEIQLNIIPVSNIDEIKDGDCGDFLLSQPCNLEILDQYTTYVAIADEKTDTCKTQDISQDKTLQDKTQDKTLLPDMPAKSIPSPNVSSQYREPELSDVPATPHTPKKANKTSPEIKTEETHDDDYFVLYNHPVQRVPEECPMCYHEFSPIMFTFNCASLKLSAQCPDCKLKVYVVFTIPEKGSPDLGTKTRCRPLSKRLV